MALASKITARGPTPEVRLTETTGAICPCVVLVVVEPLVVLVLLPLVVVLPLVAVLPLVLVVPLVVVLPDVDPLEVLVVVEPLDVPVEVVPPEVLVDVEPLVVVVVPLVDVELLDVPLVLKLVDVRGVADEVAIGLVEGTADAEVVSAPAPVRAPDPQADSKMVATVPTAITQRTRPFEGADVTDEVLLPVNPLCTYAAAAAPITIECRRASPMLAFLRIVSLR